MTSTITGPKDALNPTLEEAAATVATLVQDFSANDKYYLSPTYQEAEVRRDFIDKFLIALGWDVNHTIQKNPFQQEVKVERNVQTATAQRRADYALSLNPNFDSPVLYIEAKKPAGDIATPDNYFQIIRYANQRGHALGILTDFEQLHIIDCRFQANIESAIHRAILKYHYSDFTNPEKFAEIFYIISRAAIASGSLEKFAATLTKPKGRPGQKAFIPLAYKPIDERLLETLDELRSILARALKNSNQQLDSAALTELTQRIIDRLVFIRFLEDKLIEPDPIIPRLGESTNRSAWQDFRLVCRKLDKTYNGIVYKFHPTLDAPDGLSIDDKNFADVLNAFDYHESEYLFNDIPLHILGSIYERFLGNVIVATKKRATLEPKPEVRKAGGVYYTPKYIVDYIVQNTVGKLIDGRSPGEISKMRFADIACGSGSFLLGVYDCLLKYITRWYNEHPSKAPKAAVVKRNNALYLSLQEKGRILTDNIYGVDIDPQAVEVAQLSLYLKLLEEETTASARQYTLDFHRPLLPSLADNIKCGNSLIAPDFYENRQLDLLEPDRRKINAFDWHTEFREIMKAGGFHAIVGNPPYIRIQTLQHSSPEQVRYFKRVYPTGKKGNCDIYVLFIERATTLIRAAGRAGFILPNKFLATDYGEGLRHRLSSKRLVDTIVDFKYGQVFEGATTYTCLLFLSGQGTPHLEYVASSDPPAIARGPLERRRHGWSGITGAPWSFESDEVTMLMTKVRRAGPELLAVKADVARGSSTGADAVFTLEVTPRGLRTHDGERVDIEEAILRTPIYAGNIRRYAFTPTREERIIFPYTVQPTGYQPLPLDELKVTFPRAFKYLLGHKAALLARKQYSVWYTYSAPRSLHVHDQADFLVPLLANHGTFCTTPQDQKKHCLMASGGFSISVAGSDLHRNANLGILNSCLMFWFLQRISNIFRGGWITCTKQYVGKLPIVRICLADPAEKSRHDKLVMLVDTMLALHKQLPDASTDHARTLLQRQIEATDRQIDRLVYQLYGLTADEIKIVEEATQ